MLRKSFFSFATSRSFSSKRVFIRNEELPICSNCLHFIEHTNNYPYDPIPSDERYGKCRKFGEVNLISGVTEYDSARKCRTDDKKCSKTGLFYDGKNATVSSS